MTTYHILFTGRAKGAIGSLSRYDVTIDADTPESAVLKLYDTHEHITIHRITERATP